MWLTGDFFGIINWCHLWENSFCAILSNLKAIRMLLGPRVALYLLTRWQPLITFREMNHTQTAFERQIQTFTEAVERFTQQNHDLEEQLR